VELEVEEARVLALTMARDKTAAQLERLYMVLSQARDPAVLEARTLVAAMIRQRSSGVMDKLYHVIAQAVRNA